MEILKIVLGVLLALAAYLIWNFNGSWATFFLNYKELKIQKLFLFSYTRVICLQCAVKKHHGKIV